MLHYVPSSWCINTQRDCVYLDDWRLDRNMWLLLTHCHLCNVFSNALRYNDVGLDMIDEAMLCLSSAVIKA